MVIKPYTSNNDSTYKSLTLFMNLEILEKFRSSLWSFNVDFITENMIPKVREYLRQAKNLIYKSRLKLKKHSLTNKLFG